MIFIVTVRIVWQNLLHKHVDFLIYYFRALLDHEGSCYLILHVVKLVAPLLSFGIEDLATGVLEISLDCRLEIRVLIVCMMFVVLFTFGVTVVWALTF